MSKEKGSLEPWYKVVTPRREVRKGRSFNPDEFAIALEQVVLGTAPEDYLDPKQFFSRTVFTRALREYLGMVLRRLRGETEDTAPVLTLITQFGGGKTHTLTALYHLFKTPKVAEKDPGVRSVLLEGGKLDIPETKVAVLVGNAWDPREGRETPWIDIARQLAGDPGVAVLGSRAKTSPPGTETLNELFQLAGGRVLILCDEVLNLVNRHRDLADQFHSFIQNLTVALTGTTHSAAVISLPRSQVEMTEFDGVWQEKLTKVVRRVARELIANDESEIAEVVRRRLFEEFDDEVRSAIREAARAYSAWCYERRNQLPPEWTAVDASSSELKAREHLQRRFEECYPFHPATLSVFQRKWQTLPQYQQTRGTLAMLAQWVAWAYRDGYEKARPEAFIGLGSAPLENGLFRATVLGQLGEHRLVHAIDTDISGENSHARALDGDAKGNLKDLHRRVATTILFESSGGMVDKAAHIPEIRFAVGEPGMDTTSIDNAASALEGRAFYLRKVGRDGFRFGFKPTLRKVVGDRRAALDDAEIRKVEREAIRKEFEKGAALPIITFPKDGTEIANAPRLTVIVGDPDMAYTEALHPELAKWTRERTRSDPRLYPGALIWCLKKDNKDLLEKVELALAWKRVKDELESGSLGGEFEPSERQEITSNVREAEDEVKEEIWAGYRFVVIYDQKSADTLHVIDLGAGHASAGQTLTTRIMAALKSEGYLNENVGGGYIERNWPEALKTSGAWSLAGLRKAFLDGSLTRLPDPEGALKTSIPRLVERGDFGLASGEKPDGTYERLWISELVPSEEVTFDTDTFLLLKSRALTLRTPISQITPAGTENLGSGRSSALLVPPGPVGSTKSVMPEIRIGGSEADSKTRASFSLSGSIPPEAWNKLGIGLVPTLKKGRELSILLSISVKTPISERENFERELRRRLAELGIAGSWTIQVQETQD
ncbi:MAG: DUF499 domain-containing protein [Thermoplasmata archaeon]